MLLVLLLLALLLVVLLFLSRLLLLLMLLLLFCCFIFLPTEPFFFTLMHIHTIMLILPFSRKKKTSSVATTRKTQRKLLTKFILFPFCSWLPAHCFATICFVHFLYLWTTSQVTDEVSYSRHIFFSTVSTRCSHKNTCKMGIFFESSQSTVVSPSKFRIFTADQGRARAGRGSVALVSRRSR